MLIRVDDSEVVHEEQHHKHKHQHEILNIVDRLKEELEGFLDYKHMDAARYGSISLQEFQHAIIAFDDLFTALAECTNDKEKALFKNFIKSIDKA